ncbi:MAG: bifunctional 2-C-methyl-D-erythritol 4-phosphate cytidylyltransferase/2-C-methyl-D-erythritol 2,4-cyclodiphosphate synthase [Alphaproteobacteria bacterium]|nr:bifunctional 2-C-methyl-D-erythritol 4-phosphate cytidylyltransferase/2-C-methyl-D-erythritol 2,4-cyclodiphosphate synthase [Alphaproteobacteria bacterium]
MPKIVALITACGRGNRFNQGEGIPKQYLPLAGVPLLRHSILTFLNHPQISDVLCAIHPDDVALYEEAVSGLDLLNPVFGGETRQASIRLGLEALRDYNPNKVLIHDGVRPFVSKRIINGILEKLETHPAVIPAVAVEDTLKKTSDGKIEWTLERENLWRAQTPQGFLYQDILNSHVAFKDLHFTDDAALNEYAGIPVAIVPGSQNNFKITTEEDFERAKSVVAMLIPNTREENRCGTGFDVHGFRERFAGESGTIRICGVDIEFSKKIEAHSDGDVGIHAAIDAILGAIGEGDIGEHFPPTDLRWKNADSRDMLKTINRLLKKKGGTILNLDITLLCEKPKISKFRNQMKKVLAETLGISTTRVNVKATTTERLGFLGREEGIAAQAVVSVLVVSDKEG